MGSPSPSARALEANEWRRSWRRTPSRPARARTDCQASSSFLRCAPGFLSGITQGSPEERGRPARSFTAGPESETTRAPVLESASRSSAASSQRSERISDFRHPVRIRRRMAATAGADAPPSVSTWSSARPRRFSSASVRNRSRLRPGYMTAKSPNDDNLEKARAARSNFPSSGKSDAPTVSLTYNAIGRTQGSPDRLLRLSGYKT